MAIRDAETPSGRERERDARIKPSDIADAKDVSVRDGGPRARRFFEARAAADPDVTGPIDDDAT